MDNFENGKIHFLDLEISDSGIDIFRKSTHTGQCTRFDSFEPWSRKTAWVRSLFHRAVNICSNLTFINKQISMISKFMSWNGFPANVRFSIIRKLKAKYEVNSNAYCSKHNTNELPPQNDFSHDPRPKIWIRIPFLGKQGEFLVKKLLRKIQRNLTQPVKFAVIYDTKKMSYFLSKKDKIPNTSRSNLVYEFTCPGCNSSYIGKTERNLATRLSEHSDPQKSSIAKHLWECEHTNYILSLNHIFYNFNDINDKDTNKPDTPLSRHNLMMANTQTLHTLKRTNSNLLLFLEALYIKYRIPVLNNGLRASKELVVFS